VKEEKMTTMTNTHPASTTSKKPQATEPHSGPRRHLKRTTWAAMGFAAPLVIYLIVFYLAPLIQNISMSFHEFTRKTFVTGDAPFAGFSIYKEVLSSAEFWTTLKQTLIFVVVCIVFQYGLGLALAVFFKQNFRLNGFLRGVFLVPWLIPPMISGTTWQWMMDADSGVFNEILKAVGMNPVWWLQADHALWAVIIANIWLGIPFNLVILYSGLQNINGDLYEAAALDGASSWQQFWRITFPLLKPVTLITLLLGFVYTLKTVDIIWIMTMGVGSSQTLATWSYAMAFGKGYSSTIKYSQASVVGTVLILIALVFAFIYLWAQRNEEEDF
jgi:multiple sugar transport system permease protein